MAKYIPTAKEVKDYLDKRDAEMEDCIHNHKTYVINGSTFPGESIWNDKSTLAILAAGEQINASKEDVWELCTKISSFTHCPFSKKECERMLPFAKKPSVVDTVLKLLETYHLPLESEYPYWTLSFGVTGYYYCIALISQSDYRQEDCLKMLWEHVNYHIAHSKEYSEVLLRNMELLEKDRPNLSPMKKELIKAIKTD